MKTMMTKIACATQRRRRKWKAKTVSSDMFAPPGSVYPEKSNPYPTGKIFSFKYEDLAKLLVSMRNSAEFVQQSDSTPLMEVNWNIFLTINCYFYRRVAADMQMWSKL